MHGIRMRLLSATLLTFSLALASAAPAQETLPAFDVVEASIPALRAALDSGRITSAQLVDLYLARIEAYDRSGPALRSIIQLNPAARVEAEALDRERATNGPRGPLHGIPVLIKDNIDTANLPTTAGSIALAGVVPVDDAYLVRRLKEAGAIILGKTNLHELASGITTISSYGGQTLNPYDPMRNPGGSSGGTAAAVAASFAAVGWGTDTCGSIRIPAAFNNLFGLRPTKGLTSIDGIVPLSHTQDVAGPLARTVTDLAIALDATAGYDPADSATHVMQQRPPPAFLAALDTGALRGARIGVLEPFFADADADVSAVVRAALEALEREGASLVTVPFPGLDSLLAGTSLIEHEFKFDLAAYLAASPRSRVRTLDQILRAGLFHASLEDRLRRRNTAESPNTPAYRQALGRRAELQQRLRAVLDEHRLDALAYPTMRRRPALAGEPQAGSTCSLSAHTGFPALAAPAGFTPDSLPVGFELLARPFEDERLVALAFAWERATQPRRPPAFTPPFVNGKPPAPIHFGATSDVFVGPRAARGQAEAELDYDPVMGTLEYSIEITGVEAANLYGIALIHVPPGGTTGPVAHRLAGPATTSVSGTVTLTVPQRAALFDSRLMLVVFSRDDPTGASRVTLMPRLPGG